MKLKFFVFFMLVLSLLFVTVTSDKVETEGTFNLTAGCSYNYYIFLYNEGSSTIHDIETNILPDDEGINVSYSIELPYALKEGVNVINVTVNTSMLLAPGAYTITTEFYEEATNGGNGGNGGGDDGKKVSKVIKTSPEETPEEIPEEVIDVKDDDEPSIPEEIINVLIVYVPGFNYWLLLVPLSIFLIIVLILYKVRRKKKNEETQNK